MALQRSWYRVMLFGPISVLLTAVPAFALYYAAAQIGARNRVFPLGVRGDSFTSIVIIDTGIDTTHPGFAHGWGQGNFAKKIVGWYDPYNRNPVPDENTHHGTHCAYAAAGVPFCSLDSTGRVWITNAWGSSVYGGNQYPEFGGFLVDRPGEIRIRLWEQTGRGYFDTLYLMYAPREGNYVSGDGEAALLPFESPLDGELSMSKKARLGSRVEGWFPVAILADTVRGVWQELVYNVRPESLGLYRLVSHRVIPSGSNLRFIAEMQVPCEVDSQGRRPDGEKLFTGIAPGCKIVAVKAYAPSYWGDAFTYIINNRNNLRITCVSMSLGTSSSGDWVQQIQSCFNNYGIITVASAGNDGPGSNNVGNPALIPEVIAVASCDAADMVAAYSSQGGADKAGSLGQMKPDILAPGGAILLQGGLWSGDHNGEHPTWNYGNPSSTTNWGYDSHINDMLPFQGTSQAAPIIAGCVNLVIDALGGWAYWSDPTRGTPVEKARKVKQLLFMTATETNLFRQQNLFNAAYSPTLERGYDPSHPYPESVYYGKDRHEGYGRVNVDAAVEVVRFPPLPARGLEVRDSLWSSRAAFVEGVTERHSSTGNPLSRIDFDAPRKRHCWARKVWLEAGQTYDFYLRVAGSADFDLYLYKYTPARYGDPLLAARSVRPGMGEGERISFTPAVSDTFYLVVKAVDGKGWFVVSDGPTALTELPFLGELNRTGLCVTIMPNPVVNDFAEVRFSTAMVSARIGRNAVGAAVRLCIFDAAGRCVLEQVHRMERDASVKVDLRALPTGVYILELSSGVVLGHGKLVVQ